MVIAYSQKDPKYRDMRFSPARLKVKDFGCLICSISMILEKTPDIVIGILDSKNCFNIEGALLNYPAALALNMCYFGKVMATEPVKQVCIGETDHWSEKGIPQHFFVWLNKDNMIIDPLDGLEKLNPYHIVSWRMWEKKQNVA